MKEFSLWPGHGKKRTRDDDDAESVFFTSRKRIDIYQTHSQSNSHVSPARTVPVQAWRRLSPVSGPAADGEALAKFGTYRDLESRDADDSNDDDPNSGFPFGGRTSAHIQNIRAYIQSDAHIQPPARHQTDSNPARKNHIQMSAPPQIRIATMPVFSYTRVNREVEPDASIPAYQSFQKPQSARPLETSMNSRENVTDGPNMEGHGDPRQMALILQQRSQAPSPSPTLHFNAATPAQKKDMLGEALYPKIRELQPELTGKITGMLLEMDNAELLGLTNNYAALRTKVNEAMCIYNDYLKSQGDEGAAHGSNRFVNISGSIPAARENIPEYRKPRHESLHNRKPPRSKELPLNEESPRSGEPPPGAHVSTLPVIEYNKIIRVFEPGSSDPQYRPYQGLQRGEHLGQVEMCPRIDNMDDEGGRLYLAQTLHFYYRLQIRCPLHATGEETPGHSRHVKGKTPHSRTWSCTSQSDHKLTNTEYIGIAEAQLPHKVFVNVAEELIRQLHSKQCQSRRPNDPAQADDFDFGGIVPYVVV